MQLSSTCPTQFTFDHRVFEQRDTYIVELVPCDEQTQDIDGLYLGMRLVLHGHEHFGCIVTDHIIERGGLRAILRGNFIFLRCLLCDKDIRGGPHLDPLLAYMCFPCHARFTSLARTPEQRNLLVQPILRYIAIVRMIPVSPQ